jgi:UPF0176 protein
MAPYYQILAYYDLSSIDDPDFEVRQQKIFFKDLDFKGRIYISKDGINGQASASKEATERYIQWMRDRGFLNTVFKLEPYHEHVFPRMTVKKREQLVALDRKVDLSKRGVSVSPAVWRELLDTRDQSTLVLDVRNEYESKIGHFRGAECPLLGSFREFPEYVKSLKATWDPVQTRVMMYCTGGIRCELYSALLKEEGFELVYQLEGGVIGYGVEEGSRHWTGKLFVFDDRVVVNVGGEKSAPIANCHHCAKPWDVYYNCAYVKCNCLFLCCPDCLKVHQGCCSCRCASSGQIRPWSLDAKPFKRLSYNDKQVLHEDRVPSPELYTS